MSDVIEKIIDVTKLQQDFPILQQQFHGHNLVYLDSAATSQKPQQVINAVNRYYGFDNANVHRGVYALSERATALYEAARQTIRNFINASSNEEIIFTRGTTEAINLVAHGFAQQILKPGDEVLISAMEHHSNIVPWQIACQQSGANLNVIPITDEGEIDLNEYKKLLTPKTKIVALIHVSNVLGTVNPIKEMIEMAHQNGTPVLIDGAQAAPHRVIDVQNLDCDFYTVSSHKIYGPMGVGILYGKKSWLEKLPPYQSGGDMISQVSFEKTEYNVLPYRFEAGTPNVVGAIGMAAAIDYISEIGLNSIQMHEQQLMQYALEKLATIPGLTIIGNAAERASVISFTMENIHPHDIGTILDSYAIAVRAGHHCAMPLMDRLGLVATARISFGIYNSQNDIDNLVVGLLHVNKIMKG